MSNLVGIKFCMWTAYDSAAAPKHPHDVMKDLGITYVEAVPQSIADMWQFFGCNIPEGLMLPNYIEVVDSWRQHCE